jgi:sporulation protein YlmC with PRC-barrel domain
MKLLASALILAVLSAPAIAQTTTPMPPDGADWAPIGSAPASNFTVTNYYKQDVYDPSDNKLGTIDDVLIDKSGKVTALMVGVGGFLGMGEKDVAVPFSRIKMTKKNNKWYLTMEATKDQLKAAPGYKYDSASTTWVGDSK